MLAAAETGSAIIRLEETQMPKKQQASAVYRVTEIIGTSTTSWEDAAKNAVEIAARTLRDLKVEHGKVVAYRARVSLSFKYEE
jgi:flavin-binding protein dodecin